MFVTPSLKDPYFTSVCAIIILLVGRISAYIPTAPGDALPSSLLPTPGLSAEVVEETVTTVLEREINGVEGMGTDFKSLTMASVQSTSRSMGYDQNIAAVDVQNRVQR